MTGEVPRVGDLENIAGDGGRTPGRRSASGPPICGDIAIRIARDGTWFYHGSPIGRHRLVRLFSTVLRREDDGQFYLVTPAEKGRIVVDDAPFVAVELQAEGEGQDQVLRLRTNVDDVVTVNDEHPIHMVHDPVTREPSPYVTVRGRLDALISRPVYYELVDLAEESADRRGTYGVWSCGRYFPIGTMDDGER